MRQNDEIDVPKIRLIGEEGQQIGVVPTKDALDRAREVELDLVEIAPNADPPVCRIMDYGKYKYQQQKKKHDQSRKNHGAEMKQMRIKTFRIDMHDLEIKMKQARKFLEDNHRLLVTLMFRAREHSHSEMGETLLVEKVAKPLSDIAKMDARPAKQGRRMTMMLTPVTNVKKIVQLRKAAEEAERKKQAATEALQAEEEG